MWITTLVSQEEHNYVGKSILKLFYKRMEFKVYIIISKKCTKTTIN